MPSGCFCALAWYGNGSGDATGRVADCNAIGYPLTDKRFAYVTSAAGR